MVKYLVEGVAAAAGVLVIVVNLVFVSPLLPAAVPLIMLAGALIAVVPTVWVFYARFTITKQIEQQFILFIMDLTDAINAGMTLPIALEHVATRNYLSLSSYVNDIVAKVNWGIPFDEALRSFAKKTKSTVVRRAISTINETYRVGGKMNDALNAVSTSLIMMDRLKKERSAAVHAEIVTSYIIFFIFIFIVVILHSFLIPTITQQTGGVSIGTIGDTTFTEQEISREELSQIFSVFIVIQGFFAGLATGKMSEGSLVAGLKHSLILIAVGFGIFSVAIQLPFFQFSTEVAAGVGVSG